MNIMATNIYPDYHSVDFDDKPIYNIVVQFSLFLLFWQGVTMLKAVMRACALITSLIR